MKKYLNVFLTLSATLLLMVSCEKDSGKDNDEGLLEDNYGHVELQLYKVAEKGKRIPVEDFNADEYRSYVYGDDASKAQYFLKVWNINLVAGNWKLVIENEPKGLWHLNEPKYEPCDTIINRRHYTRSYVIPFGVQDYTQVTENKYCKFKIQSEYSDTIFATLDFDVTTKYIKDNTIINLIGLPSPNAIGSMAVGKKPTHPINVTFQNIFEDGYVCTKVVNFEDMLDKVIFTFEEYYQFYGVEKIHGQNKITRITHEKWNDVILRYVSEFYEEVEK